MFNRDLSPAYRALADVTRDWHLGFRMFVLDYDRHGLYVGYLLALEG